MRTHIRQAVLIATLIVALEFSMPRRARGEDFIDLKTMYYQEERDRVTVWTPSFLLQKETESGLVIKIEGLYDSMTGATPTGAPPTTKTTTAAGTARTTTTTTSGGTTGGGGDDENDNAEEDAALIPPARTSAAAFNTIAGATAVTGGGTTGSGGTTTTTPSGGSSTSSTSTTIDSSGDVPKADFRDERYALSIDLSKNFGNHTPGVQLAYSKERDYVSYGLSLRDAAEFNRKNSTLTYGGAFTRDEITPKNSFPGGDKNSYDVLLGLTQVLTPDTLWTINATLGYVEGLLTDPYKVVLLNSSEAFENRPGNKTKEIIFTSLNQHIKPLNGSMELGLRYYHDTYGIDSGTASLAWLQKIGDIVVITPMLRYAQQTEADFYDISFTGAPEFYSSDYRLSAFRTFSYGLKVDWNISARFAFNLAFERYEQQGTDGVTPDDAYTKANIVTAGIRIWL